MGGGGAFLDVTRCVLCVYYSQLLECTTKLADFERLSDIVSRYEAPSVITGHSVNDGGRRDIRQIYSSREDIPNGP